MLHDIESKTRVVIVEDDLDLAHMLRLRLERENFLVAVVSDPAMVEQEAEEWGAHIILMDINLPGGRNGVSLGKALKDARHWRQVIYMTGYADSEAAIDAFESGGEALLLKPFRDMGIPVSTVKAAEGKFRAWCEAIRESLRREFPEEYDIIYGESQVPTAEDLEKLLAEATQG